MRFGFPLPALCAFALALLAGCAGGRPDAGEPVADADLARAHEALGPFQRELMGALSKAMADGGPEAAIDVCRTEAPAIAAAAGGADIEIGRTSHRLRNPANAPRPWMEPLLAAYVADPANAKPRAVRLGKDRIGYVEPIRVKGMCLSCHGENVSASILERVRAHYPEDAATGFADGDLRGMFWVELPASS